MHSIAISSTPIDFLSQVSDLRKRKALLWDEVLHKAHPNSERWEQARKALKKTENALACIDGLEVTPD